MSDEVWCPTIEYRSPGTTPPDARLARYVTARDGVVTIEELRSLGFTDSAVAARVRGGRLHRLHRGVYAVGHPAVSLRGRFRAAVLASGPGTVLAHHSAAAHVRMVRWRERPVEVTTVRGHTRRIAGVRVHRCRSLDARDVTWRDGIPVTTPARTLLDLAATMPERELRRVVRQAQAEDIVAIAQVRAILTRSSGHRGVRALRAVVADGPAPTRSALEDALLDLLDSAGIERPELNPRLRVDGATIVPDMLWRGLRLAIEADGAAWHDNKLTREHDAVKQARLEAAGLRVMRVTWAQVVGSPQQTLARIDAARAAALSR